MQSPMFWPRTGVKHARNVKIITIFGNLISVFSMFQACFHAEHWSMPAVIEFLQGVTIATGINFQLLKSYSGPL
jgi:hypothetical protein